MVETGVCRRVLGAVVLLSIIKHEQGSGDRHE
jgi:hypothetical protein